MPLHKGSALIKFIFFGNYFYGICAVALCIEATLQQHFTLNTVLFYIMVFSATVLYYTKAYLPITSADSTNIRAIWYANNNRLMRNSQLFFSIVLLICTAIFVKDNWKNIWTMPLLQWLLVFIFPLAGVLYYRAENKLLGKYNLRKIGWLKPFIIGFVWAGLVTVYPVVYQNIETNTHYQLTFLGSLLFLKNFMFVTVLCIMFDIKDYANDHNQHINTFVVRVGLRKTIFYILIPLCILGLGSFLSYGTTHHFSLTKILLNTIPFILLITVAYSLHQRKPILYYLILIDGLMLVKAICGSIAMIFF